jgi:bacterioferritin
VTASSGNESPDDLQQTATRGLGVRGGMAPARTTRNGPLGPPPPKTRKFAMKGDPKVIEILNLVLKNELTAINQYFLHSRMFNNWGLTRLGAYEYHESVDEMKHADRIVSRILFLEGLPNLQDLGRLRIGEDVPESLRADLALELEAAQLLREGVAYCESIREYVSRDLLASILRSEEQHIDWLETNLALITKVGIQNYLQSQMGEHGEVVED